MLRCFTQTGHQIVPVCNKLLSFLFSSQPQDQNILRAVITKEGAELFSCTGTSADEDGEMQLRDPK